MIVVRYLHYDGYMSSTFVHYSESVSIVVLFWGVRKTRQV